MRRTTLSYSQIAWLAMMLIGNPVLAQTAQNVKQMSDELRDSISRIVILPVAGEGGEAITGTYGQETRGLAGGMAKGAEIGQFPVEVGQVPVVIPIPILREIGMLFGGVSGALERRTQELYDRMAEDLATEVEQPLSNIALATDVFWGLNDTQGVDPKLFAVTTPIPPDTDAVLYINIDEVTLNIQEKDAIVTTSATAVLQKQSDSTILYRTTASYSDRDELKNWASNDYVLWREYRQFARHYLARELTDELYARIRVGHRMKPVYGDGIKPDKMNPWHGQTKSVSPTLSWAYELTDEAQVQYDESAVSWTVELYDTRQPVYRVQRIQGTQFALDVPLEPCMTYYWSVRPAYTSDGKTRYGTWMRRETGVSTGNGNEGRAVSEAHAYIQDFASFEVDCRAR